MKNYEIKNERERTVLGLLASKPLSYFQICKTLDFDSFASEIHQDIYNAIKAEILASRGASFLDVKENFAKKYSDDKDSMAYLEDLVSVYGLSFGIDLKHYAKEIADEANKRNLKLTLEQMGNMLNDEEVSPEEVLGNLLTSYQETGYSSPNQTFDIGQLFAELEESSKTIEKSYKLGLPIIDQGIGGGVKPGQLLTLAGKYKSGKSTLALQFATSLKNQGLKVKWLALEMGAEEILHKLLAREMDTTETFLSDRILPNFQHNKAEIIKHFKAFGCNQLLVTHIRAANTERLISAIYESIHRDKVDVVIIDYLQLVVKSTASESHTSFLEDLSSKVLGAIRDNNLIGIVLTQLGRSGETYGTDGMNRACDVALTITKDDPQGNIYSIESTSIRKGSGFNGESAFKNKNGTHFVEA